METIIVVLIVGIVSALMIRSFYRKITNKTADGKINCAGCHSASTCHIINSHMDEKKSS